MLSITKVSNQDLKEVYPLFHQSPDLTIPEKDFQQLFKKHWDKTEDYFGYKIEDKGKVVGYLGYIFKERMIDGKLQKFCNLTSWNVLPEYRRSSLQLLLPILKQPEYTITTFTGGDVTNLILQKTGFEIYESHLQVIPFWFNPFGPKCSVTYDPKDIEGRLKGEDLQAFQDHRGFDCVHVLIQCENESTYMIIQRMKKKNLPFGFIHYISNLSVFKKTILGVSASICLQLKAVGLIMYKRLMGNPTIFPSFSIKLNQPALFKSDHCSAEDIDSLYSEFFVLNLQD